MEDGEERERTTCVSRGRESGGQEVRFISIGLVARYSSPKEEEDEEFSHSVVSGVSG